MLRKLNAYSQNNSHQSKSSYMDTSTMEQWRDELHRLLAENKKLREEASMSALYVSNNARDFARYERQLDELRAEREELMKSNTLLTEAVCSGNPLKVE